MAISNIVTRLPIILADSQGPVISQADLSPLIPPDPIPVDDYYIFGSDNPTMRNIAGTNPLQRNITFAVTAGGSGYATAPAVTLSGGGGSGATAEAVLTSGAITGIVLTAPGLGYTSSPTVSFSGGGGTGAAATASLRPAPTHNLASLTIPATGSNGVITPFTDLLEMTEIMVVRAYQTNPAQHMHFGTLAQSAGPGTGGDSVYATTSYAVNTRGISSITIAPPAGMPNGGLAMIAHRQSSSSPGRTVAWGNAGALLKYDTTVATKTISAPLRKRALGNAYYTGALDGAVEIAAYAKVAGALSDANLLKVYARMVKDQAARGNTVY